MQDQSANLLASLDGVDLRSADGPAGIATALAVIENIEPGAILRAICSGVDRRGPGLLDLRDGGHPLRHMNQEPGNASASVARQ